METLLFPSAKPRPNSLKPDFSETEPAWGSHRFSNKQLSRRCRLFRMMNIPGMVYVGANILTWMNQKGILRKWMSAPHSNIFCGGQTLEACQSTIRELGRYGIQ